MTLEQIESLYGFQFPDRHRKDLEDRSSPIHSAVEFLFPDDPGIRDFVRCNEELRSGWKKAGVNVVAFATQGCGDFHAYDISETPYQVFVIDPTSDVAESLAAAIAQENALERYDEWRERIWEIHEEVEADFEEFGYDHLPFTES
ncbi:MAG: hypothetical protein AAF229_05605 [Pseudomonadota bacterium]